MRNIIASLIVLLTAAFILLTGCADTNENNDARVDLMVSAAISLTDALQELKTVYEKEHNVSLTFNLGSSGKLAQQIENDAPSDVFISANEDWMDRLVEKNKIDSESLIDLTGNAIVLITGEDTDRAIDSISDIQPDELDQVAIGNPDSVPAGKYTEQTLKNLHLWEPIGDHIILAKDVRQVLTYVETGNTDLGFVYESDAQTSDKVKIMAIADDALHDPIIYPGAVVSESNQQDAATQFLEFLTTREAQAIFKKHGFTN